MRFLVACDRRGLFCVRAQLGGIVLHEGQIAEMATGEGKTLVATLPAYLNALSGRGVHMVTVNDYLARRDAEWCAQPSSCSILSSIEQHAVDRGAQP